MSRLSSSGVGSRSAILFGLVALLAFHAGFNLWWLEVDNHPIASDGDGHLGQTYAFYQEMTDDTDDMAECLVNLWSKFTTYPPLLYVIGALFALVLGPDRDAIAYSNTVFFLLMIWGTYLLAATFFSRRQALYCALIVSFTPILFSASRYLCLDFFSAAFVPWILYALARTERFSRTPSVLAFSVLAGLAGLTKPISVFFWILPGALMVVGSFLEAWRSDQRTPETRRRRNAVLLNIGIAILLIPAISMPWYLYHLHNLMSVFTTTLEGQGTFGLPQNGLDLLTYPFLLVNLAVFLPMFLLALLGAACTVCRKSLRNSAALLVLLSAAGGYLLLTLFVHERGVRYILPAVPPLSLLAAIALIEIPWKRIRVPGRPIFALLLLAQFFGMTCTSYEDVVWGEETPAIELPGIEYQHREYMFTYTGSRRLSFFRPALLSVSYSFCPPLRGDHYVARFYRVIAEDLEHRPPSTGAIGFQTLSTRGISGISYRFLAGRKVYRFDPSPDLVDPAQEVRFITPTGPEGKTPSDLLGALPLTDYILIRSMTPETGIEQSAFFSPFGFETIDHFFDKGYGYHAVPGYYFILARQNASVKDLPPYLPANDLAGFWGMTCLVSDLPRRMQTITSDHPDDWLAQYLLGLVLERVEQLDPAESAYRRALSLEPELLARAKLCVFLAAKAEELARQGDRLAAMKTLMDAGILAEGGSREAVNEFGLDPRNLADLLIDLGRRASAAEDIDNMRLCYCQAHTIAQDSEDLSDIAEDLLHWGKVLRQRMDLDDSIELLQEASDVFPNNGFIVEALEQTILLTGDKKDALVLCKDELLANPELFQLYSRLDSLLKDRGDAAYRIEVWRNMVNSHEEAVAAYYYLGQALEAIEDWEGAQDVYRKGHDLDPEDGRFPGPLAWVQFQLGQKGPVKRAPRMGMRRIPEREPAPATAAIMPPELTYQPVRITGQSGF